MQCLDYQFIELEAIQLPLVNRFYKQVYKKGLARNNETVFILKNKTIICSAKLKNIDNHKLLTGVACDPLYRSQGCASQLIKQLLQQQLQPIYCFPYPHLQHFYSRLGFVQVDPQTTPLMVKQKFETYKRRRTLLMMVFTPDKGFY